MYNASKTSSLGKLIFNWTKHEYAHDGFKVPSVTKVIEPLLPYGGMPSEVREQALLRGSLVHSLTALADQGKPWEDEAKQTHLTGYVQAWEDFKRTTSIEIVDIETRVYHSKLRYAGTLDRAAHLYGANNLSIIEIKTGALVPEYALQTAAYLHAYNEGRMENKATKRYAVQLEPDGKYKVTEHNDKADFDVFVASLVIANWRLKRGGS